MNTILKPKIIFIFSLILTNCHRQVTLTFRNKTGYSLDSLTIAGHFVGQLKNNACIDMQDDSVYFDSGSFLDRAECFISGKKTITDDSMHFCGTEIEIKNSGSFIQEIYLDTSGIDSHLYFGPGREN